MSQRRGTKEGDVYTFDYDQTDIHLHYNRASHLSSRDLDLWIGVLLQYVPRDDIQTIVDLGCGTGTFTGALADTFCATVYGVDPSAKMLNVARATNARRNVQYLRGSAEQTNLPAHEANLVFLSMVYDHLHDKEHARREMQRLLKRDGYVAIRTATRERIDTALWPNFFPAARHIELEHLPSRQELAAYFSGAGLHLQDHEVLRQQFAYNLTDYCEKISLRGRPSLRTISDAEFASGLAALSDYCWSHNENRPIYEEAELFVFGPHPRPAQIGTAP